MQLPAILKKAMRCEAGTSAIEYGMILAVFVLMILVAIDSLADETADMWSDISTKSAHAMSGN